MVHQLAQGYALAATVLGKRVQHLLAIFQFFDGGSVNLSRRAASGRLCLRRNRYFPLLAAEILQHHALIDIDRVAAVKTRAAARCDPELVFSRPRLVVGSTRDQEPLPGKFTEPGKSQVSKLDETLDMAWGSRSKCRRC